MIKTPFTLDQFLDVFKQYNEAVFPAQILFYLVALAAMYLAIKPTATSDRWIIVILAFLWLWMGIKYHPVFFSPINKAAFLFGSAFVIQGALLLVMGVFQQKLSFRFQPNSYGWTGMALILFALLVYPLLGSALGHSYPSSPTFGLPCPTTIFTFGMLLQSSKKCPISLLIIPFLWSIIGFTAAFHFGILEDTGLLIAGLITLPMVILKNRSLNNQDRINS